MTERLPLDDLASALVTATRALGENSQRVSNEFSNYGMPSEYRSGLFAAADEGQRFLRRRRTAAARRDERDLIGLAEDIVQIVHAVIFAMKHGLPYEKTMDAAVNSLNATLSSLGTRDTTRAAS